MSAAPEAFGFETTDRLVTVRRVAAAFVMASVALAGKIAFDTEPADPCAMTLAVHENVSADYVIQSADGATFKINVGDRRGHVLPIEYLQYGKHEQPTLWDIRSDKDTVYTEVDLQKLDPKGPEVRYPLGSHSEVILDVTPNHVGVSCHYDPTSAAPQRSDVSK